MKRRIQQYFLAGLLVWLPMGITVWVLMWLVGLLDGIFLTVLGGANAVLPGLALLTEKLRHIPGLGVILVVVVMGGAFEVRTAVAMTLRTAFWVAQALILPRVLGSRRMP